MWRCAPVAPEIVKQNDTDARIDVLRSREQAVDMKAPHLPNNLFSARPQLGTISVLAPK